MNEHFGDVLAEQLITYHRTCDQIAKITDLPRQTLISWKDGRVKKPRSWEDIIEVGKAIPLSWSELDRLLLAAKHHKLEELIARGETLNLEGLREEISRVDDRNTK